MKTLNTCRIMAAAAALALGTATFAQDMGESGADKEIMQQLSSIRQSGGEMTTDKLFVLHTAMNNIYEVEYSRMVGSKTNDPQIKELTQQLQQDHSKANELLKPIAQELDVTMPSGLPSMKQEKLAILSALPTEKLEKAFLAHQKAAHAETLTSFADYSNMVTNEKLKTYTTTMLPKLQAHTMHIVKVAQSKGVTGELLGGASMSGAGSKHSGQDMNSAGAVTPGDRGDTTNRATDNRSAGERRD
ncbi:MAG TPA: DUF4142 domain-containing protein [Tepidisphaeraceae bacterium]|jgi:predicted outer membrane protein